MWARRMVIGSGLALASLVVVPNMAAAAEPTTVCYNTMQEVIPCAAVPVVSGNSDGLAPATTLPSSGSTLGTATPTSTTSLPFTGADVEELAVVGVGAVLAGGLLLRRRRRNVA
jgi:LPXTG-motif cell wall-anchored protein